MLPANVSSREVAASFSADADKGGQLAVHIDAQGGLVEGLLYACVRHARDARDTGEKAVGVGAVRLAGILAHHLDRSIGAGKPKLTICVMMSAGNSAKVVPGKALGRMLAQLPGILVGRWRLSA